VQCDDVICCTCYQVTLSVTAVNACVSAGTQSASALETHTDRSANCRNVDCCNSTVIFFLLKMVSATFAVLQVSTFWALTTVVKLLWKCQLELNISSMRPFYKNLAIANRSRVIFARHHSIDHTHRTISRVIWCWISWWPWNVG